MSVLSPERILLVGTAGLVGEEDRLVAWAERHVRKDPDLRWVLGNYVEADRANSNGHIFPLAELAKAKDTLPGKPLNMMHREHYIVGAFVGAEIIGAEQASPPTIAWSGGISTLELRVNSSWTSSSTNWPAEQAPAAAEVDPPHVEALAGLWHTRFPEEFFNIQRAHADGTLFYSMESIPEDVSCPTCAHRAPFAGLSSDSYCEHMQGATGPKILHNPVFNGGAIIIPPVRPGWSRADIKAISRLVTEAPEAAESVYAQIAAEAPHLDPKEWEAAMGDLLLLSRDFSTNEREKLAKNGNAMPDGSYPIKSRKDVQNAIQAIGRAKNPTAVKAHIKRMAKKLGCEDLIPEAW